MNKRKQDQEDSKKSKEDVSILTRIVSTKTVWQGFEDLCRHIKREPTHVISFFEAELDVNSNPGQEGAIILQGKFQTKQILALYRKYMENYVRCSTCRSTNTELKKD